MDIIEQTMRREGWDKFTDRSSDRGGPTKWGVTQQAWSEHIKRPATIDEIKAITEQQAREFYFETYLSKPRFDLILDLPLREFVFDCGVNHGVVRAAQWLQTAAGALPDGKVGGQTLHVVNSGNSTSILIRMIAIRQRFYAQIASDQLPADPDLPNLRGWISRASAFLDELAQRLEGR